MEEEDVATGQRHHCCSAYLTFVNLRAQQTKGALPRVVPDSPHHHTVYEQALTRREHRLQAKQRARVLLGDLVAALFSFLRAGFACPVCQQALRVHDHKPMT